MANRAVKFGVAALVVGLLSFVLLFLATDGMGPCASDAQVALALLGLAGTGIGGVVLLVSAPIVLIRKYKAPRLPNSLHIQ